MRTKWLAKQRKQLVREGRPEYWLRRIVGGAVALGVGAVLGAGALSYAWIHTTTLHNEPAELNDREKGAVIGGLVASAGLAAIGSWALATAGRPNLYHGEIEALEAELLVTRQQVQQLRRARRGLGAFHMAPQLVLGPSLGMSLKLAARF